MPKIANISREKRPDIAPCWQLGAERIIIDSYCLRRGRARKIAQLDDKRCDLIAIDHQLRQKACLSWPFFVAEGKVLTLALLPQLLDQQRPQWRKENIGISCNGLAGFLAVMRLMTETDRISLNGVQAAAISSLLYHKYGMIVEQRPADFSLRELILPRMINTIQGEIPIEIAEALLVVSQGGFPGKKIRFLRQLAAAAERYGFSLSAVSAT